MANNNRRNDQSLLHSFAAIIQIDFIHNDAVARGKLYKWALQTFTMLLMITIHFISTQVHINVRRICVLVSHWIRPSRV